MSCDRAARAPNRHDHACGRLVLGCSVAAVTRKKGSSGSGKKTQSVACAGTEPQSARGRKPTARKCSIDPPARILRVAHTAVRGKGTAGLPEMRRAGAWLLSLPMHRLQVRASRAAQLQRSRILPELRRQTHDRHRRASDRSRRALRARAPVRAELSLLRQTTSTATGTTSSNHARSHSDRLTSPFVTPKAILFAKGGDVIFHRPGLDKPHGDCEYIYVHGVRRTPRHCSRRDAQHERRP